MVGLEKLMWLLTHKGRQIVVGSYRTRAEAYNARRAMKSISEERFVVERLRVLY